MTRAATPLKPKVTTLKRRADFLRLNRGAKWTAPYFILRYGPSPLGPENCRVGYTVTTKCGNAVTRNRIKRRLRALVAELFPEHAKNGTDYVLIARAEASQALTSGTLDDLRQALIKALAKAAGR